MRDRKTHGRHAKRHDAPEATEGADDVLVEEAGGEGAGPGEDVADASPDSGTGGSATEAGSPEARAEQEAESELGRQLDELQSEFDDLNDRHLRLAAEFRNYRRRAEEEMGGTWARAQADLVRRFLDVFDDLQRVSGLDPDDDAVSVQSIVEGVDLVERKFMRALEESGVEVVDPSGQPFDPERMEAVMRAPAASAEEDDLVGQVFQRGYLLKGHLIRPARVSVRKHE